MTAGNGASPPSAADAGTATLGRARAKRPLHLRPSYVLLVMAGGVFGTLARYGLGHAVPAPGGWPLPTLAINLCGAFALGLLLEALLRRGPDTGRRRTLRLLAGTGFLGAFTTYSTLALDAVSLLSEGRSGAAAAYLGLSLVGGAVASWAGIWAGARHHRRSLVRGATGPVSAAGPAGEEPR